VCFNDVLFIYFYVSLSAKEMQTLTLNSETCWISNADVKIILEKLHLCISTYKGVNS